MKKQSVLSLILILILMFFVAACGGSNAPVAEPTAVPEEVVAEEPTAEESAVEEPATPVPSGGGEEPVEEVPALDENGVPTDVPLMDGLYDLRVEANNTRIIYKIDGTIEDVVTYYQAELPTLGWGQTLGADSAVGAMGMIGRQNEKLDKLSMNLIFNPNGNFVIVTIDVIRAR